MGVNHNLRLSKKFAKFQCEVVYPLSMFFVLFSCSNGSRKKNTFNHVKKTKRTHALQFLFIKYSQSVSAVKNIRHS